MIYLFISGEIRSGQYIYNLPRGIEGQFNIALTDIAFQNFIAPVFVLCDIATTSLINDKTLPILRRVDSKKSIYNHMYYLKIELNTISKIRLGFLDRNLSNITDTSFWCTLCLEPVKQV